MTFISPVVPPIFNQYDPTDWYWSDPGLGVYGSARNALVTDPDNDVEYQSWLALTDTSPVHKPTPWPMDATGAVTFAALDQVLINAGLPATGLASK